MGTDRSAPPARLVPTVKQAVRRGLPDWYIAIQQWRRVHGVFPHIFRPRTFNEKILHRILFDRRPLLNQFADKAAVRDYVEQRIGPQLLPDLYWLTDRPETIPFDALPDRFVVKPTHGSGWVKLVHDKSQLDREALLRTCNAWLKDSLYQITREWAYKDVKPQILIEEFIDDGNEVPHDYKLFVFEGVVAFMHIDMGRFGDNHRRRLYTPQWQEINGRFGGSAKVVGDLPAPPHLAQMIEAAEILGHGVDFVRVDFYDTGKRLYFGELTMTPGVGHNRFEPYALDRKYGDLWKQRTS